MIRAAISRTFLRKDKEEQAPPARQQRTLRTSKTALFQAVLGESYHFTYERAVLALRESYPAYSGCKGSIPGYTALSDWLCHRVANTLVSGFPSETLPTVEKGSPQGGVPEYYGCYTPISGRFRRDPRLQVFFSFEEIPVPLVELKFLM